MGDVTPTQWAALAKLHEIGPTSKNLLGRMTAMDVATIKGVVDRLMKRGFLRSKPDAADARRRLIAFSGVGRAFVEASFVAAHEIARETLAPLGEGEQAAFFALLEKLKQARHWVVAMRFGLNLVVKSQHLAPVGARRKGRIPALR